MCENGVKGVDMDNLMALVPGWSGGLGDDEILIVLAQLRSNPQLKRLWGFTGRVVTEAGVQRVAEWGKPGDPSFNRRLVTLNPSRRNVRAGDPISILQGILPDKDLLSKQDMLDSAYDWEATPQTIKTFFTYLQQGREWPPVAEYGARTRADPYTGELRSPV